MRIRRYVASSLDEAVARVKKELGRDAVILEVRRIRAPGFWGWLKRRRVEVTAAVAQPALTPPAAPRLKASPPPKPAPRPETVFKPTPLPPVAPAEDIMPERLRTPYLLVQKQTDSLISRGVQPQLARQIVGEALETLTTEELSDGKALERGINRAVAHRFQTQNHKVSDHKTIVFIGPTGVGKTTTIAKLAAVYKLQRGKDVALITTDTYRIAAVEQLQRYAEILHLPLEVVYTATDLQVAWDRHQKAEMVLIDTAGRSPQQELYLAELKTLLAPIPDIQTVLVVSATTKAEDLDLIFDRFQIFAPDELILTKVDETRSAGTLLNLVDRMKVPVTFVCNGQNVPDDLMVANPQLLADLVLGGANHA